MASSRDFVITALALSVLTLGVVTWRQHQAMERLLADGAEAEEASATLETAATWSARPDPFPGVDLVPGRSETPLRARIAPARAPVSQEQLAGVVAMLEDPRFLRAVAAHQRSMLDARFGELFGKLDLTAEELESLRALLIEKQNAAMDVLMVSRGELTGEGLAGNEMRTATRRAQAEIDRMIQQTLGDQRFAVYKAYEATLPQRAAVAQLQQRLSYTNEPLQSGQAEALVSMLSSSSLETQPALPGVSVVVDPDERQAVPIMNGLSESVKITDAVIARAEEVLNPRQVMALRELQQEQRAATLVVELARQSMPVPDSNRLDVLGGIDVQLLLQ